MRRQGRRVSSLFTGRGSGAHRPLTSSPFTAGPVVTSRGRGQAPTRGPRNRDRGETMSMDGSGDTSDQTHSVSTQNAEASSPGTGAGGGGTSSGLRGLEDHTKRVERKLKDIQDQQGKLMDVVLELKQLVKQVKKDNFTIKGGRFEAPLRSEMAKLFCHSLTREPTDEAVESAVVSVMGRSARDRYKFEVGYKYCRNKLTDFRTEERRKVLGINLYSKYCLMSTADLATQIMKQMHAPEDCNEDTYIRNLALLRQFVRQIECTDTAVNYASFRQWLTDRHINWEQVMREDEETEYESYYAEYFEISRTEEVATSNDQETLNAELSDPNSESDP